MAQSVCVFTWHGKKEGSSRSPFGHQSRGGEVTEQVVEKRRRRGEIAAAAAEAEAERESGFLN